MQTITDKTEIGLFLQDMSRSLTDHSSWQGWYLFEFTTPKKLVWTQQAKITSLLREMFAGNEGTVLWTEGSVVCIMRATGDLDVAGLANGLNTLSDGPKVTLRMLCVAEEREQMLALIDHYTGGVDRAARASHASYGELKTLVPGIDDLLKNWHAVKSQRKDRAKPVIMVTDDDAMMVALVKHILEKNYTVVTARSGREALENHLTQAPDVVFLDLGLPDCSGLSVLNYMQQCDEECQIIVFTADTYLRTQVNALAGGADGFLPKPFNRQSFETYIARWIPPGQRTQEKSGS
ncbi:MAG: response regulator [Alphaproteobacteria bacterium]|nr:response regulator [Alphaproteobacteria bacterium]